MEEKHERPPTVPKLGRTCGKVMCTVFFDTEGIVSIDFLPKGETINSTRYISSLKKAIRAVSRKRPMKRGHRFMLHQNNARPHVSRETMTFLEVQKTTTVKYPPYSPDLAPADLFLFPRMKKMMREKQLKGAADLEHTVRHVLEGVSKEGLGAAFTQWVGRLRKCVRIGGGYVEI